VSKEIRRSNKEKEKRKDGNKLNNGIRGENISQKPKTIHSHTRGCG